MSVLVGQEKEEAQEKIVSGVLKKIVERKGNNFCLKLLEGGGKEGCSNKVTVGTSQESITVLPIEVFREIKKSLKQSKKKMDDMCKILRTHKIKMTPNVKVKLREMDHLLDDEYVTVRVKMTKTETVEVEDKDVRTNEEPKKVKLGKTTERVKVEVERDITLLKDTKSFNHG